jgi:hypothetical protein
MNSNTAIATGMFALANVAMALFLFVWCLKGLVAFRELRRARHGKSRSSFEMESNARGLALLRNWLSPAQLRLYEKHQYFEVTGNDSGGIYRIHHGKQANIEQLDSAGKSVCAWCFVPEGDLVPGDVMLAQKIALETNERAALAVAIRYTMVRNCLVTRPAALSTCILN